MNIVVVLAGSLKGKTFSFEDEITIGRAPDNIIQLDDMQVSRKHAKIIRTQNGFLIRDLGSGNGTFVRNRRVSECMLENGDIIQIGRQQLKFRFANTDDEIDQLFGHAVDEFNDPDVAKGVSSARQALVAGKAASEAGPGDETDLFESSDPKMVYQTFFTIPGKAATDHEAREIQRRLQAVYAANEAIASARELSRVFETVLNQVFRLLDASNGVILLKKPEENDLYPAYEKCAESSSSVSYSHTIVDRAFQHGEAVITNDAFDDSRFRAGVSIIAHNIRSAICAPLLHQSECLGVIYVDSHGRQNAFTDSDLQLLVALAGPAATAIKNAQYFELLQQAYEDTLVVLANAIELRDHYTVGHTWRVTHFAMAIARELGWNEEKLKEVRMGGVMHDVGKIAVDNAILSKAGPLTDEEFAKMKVHPERGADLLRDVKVLQPLIPYCLYHHERWDGKGYPFGLKGEDIPIEGRLIAVADAFDAMTSTRPYRKGLPPDVAFKEIIKGRGVQFDPEIVDALILSYQKGHIDAILQDFYAKESRSLSCPFCSTYIRLDDHMKVDEIIECHVCHRKIRIKEGEGRFFGELIPLVAGKK
ncbi:MAG TPA: HD domain-containing protein [Candidatus Hydrogenedentes bacterium]|nr:HD domain-containing protein [Candidatus Hydrogenedentota bacterium]HOJ68374.1 HD domain-containing protein [Candidatus Hydrogenedentota bacterium]HOK89821.1 HD domain-containing protein [Candidatus Hydrogenedentota bacterium]